MRVQVHMAIHGALHLPTSMCTPYAHTHVLTPMCAHTHVHTPCKCISSPMTTHHLHTARSGMPVPAPRVPGSHAPCQAHSMEKLMEMPNCQAALEEEALFGSVRKCTCVLIRKVASFHIILVAA